MSSEAILSHILTLCEVVSSSSNYPSQIIEDRIRRLRTAIDDYFAARETESVGGDLNIDLGDSISMGDFVG